MTKSAWPMTKNAWLLAALAASLPLIAGCKSKPKGCNTCARVAPSAPLADGTAPYVPPMAPEGSWDDAASAPLADGGAIPYEGDGYIPPAPPIDAGSTDALMPPPGTDPLTGDGYLVDDVAPPSASVEALPAPVRDQRLDTIAARRDRLDDFMSRLGPPPTVPVATEPVPSTGGSLGALASDLRALGSFEVIEESGTVVMRMTNAFASGSDQLKRGAGRRELERAARVVAQHGASRVDVVGHTDTQPIRISGWESNQALSLARARTVATVLEQGGVARTQMQVNGLGEMEPLVMPERTASDRARNRRVEIRIR